MTYQRFIALLLLMSSFCAYGRQQNPPAAYRGPQRIDLSGLWDFKLDPERTGEAEHWYAPVALANGQSWRQLAVPGSFNEQLASNANQTEASDKMRFLQGVAWYRTTFVTPRSGNLKHCFLHLSGVVLRESVWLNGKLVGRGDLPYLDVSYEVSSLLSTTGLNTLAIEIDNTIAEVGIPDTYWHGWWNDGGLIRPVYLELRPELYGESHADTTMTGSKWQLQVETSIHKPVAKAKVDVAWRLTDSSGNLVARHTIKTFESELKFVFPVPQARSWSPEHPVLYTLTTTVARADLTSIQVGFRQIEARGTQVLLNGQPYQIHGVSRHQFLAGTGMSLSVAQDRKDMQEVKALGANFVRLAHYSQSQDVYDACDELGLMVWTEIPAWQSRKESLGDEGVWLNSAKPQLQRMVMQHRDHPSVVIWSVGNEIPSENAIGAAYVARAVAYVKSLDKTRLVTFASDRRLGDKAFGSVDLIAINEYFGWYYGKQDDVGPMLDQMHTQFPKKPILVSEFGADGVADWNAATAVAESRDYSYAAESVFLGRHLAQIFAPQRSGFIAGGLVWVYNDFPDPHRLGGDHPATANYRNNKGLVTMDRTHKPAYDLVQSFFSGLMNESSQTKKDPNQSISERP